MTEITMPRLSDSMERGTILTWLRADGERVAKDEDLVEIETDKATMTYPSPGEGWLSILAPLGSELPVGAPIASLLTEAPATDANPQPAQSEGDRGGYRDAAPAPHNGDPAAGIHFGGSDAEPVKVRATPIARRLAQVHGVSLAAVTGSGPHGRVIRADVAAVAGVRLQELRHSAAWLPQEASASTDSGARVFAQPVPTASAVAVGARSAGGQEERMASEASVQKLTRAQQLIARRMAKTQSSVPDFQVQTEVAMDAALALRANLKQATGEQRIPPSLNDIVVKACALALRQHPLANASYSDDGFQMHQHVNVGIAVAAEQALLVPVIVDADKLSLGSIASQARRLAERARAGTIAPSELSGATFTVSNLGMYGMTAIKPIVDMPQAAILGVGALRSVLMRDADGEIADSSLMTLTLSCDHRILYGAEAASFLADVKALLEAPMRLVL